MIPLLIAMAYLVMFHLFLEYYVKEYDDEMTKLEDDDLEMELFELDVADEEKGG